MRILEIITPSKIGGAEVNLVSFVQALHGYKDEVTVFCPSGRPFINYLTEHGITPHSWKTWGKLDPKTLLGLTRLIKARRFDIIHAHLSSASFIGSLAGRLTHTRCAATVHGLTYAGWYRFADRLIAVSEAVKAHLMSQGIAERKIRVIHNGIPLERYQPRPLSEAKLACGFSLDVPRVGIFGRLSPVKGHSVALTAWPRVLRRFPNARLMLVGEGNTEQELRRQAEQLAITDSVEFVGFVTDPRALMAACDVVTMPSRSEGLSLVALEAMALERPLVVSDAGGLIEVITHEETGLVVPREDAPRLADALLRVLDDAALAARLGAAGRARVSAHFSAARQMALMRDALREEAQQEKRV